MRSDGENVIEVNTDNFAIATGKYVSSCGLNSYSVYNIPNEIKVEIDEDGLLNFAGNFEFNY